MSELLQYLQPEHKNSGEANVHQEEIPRGFSKVLRDVLVPADKIEKNFGISYYDWMGAIEVNSEDDSNVYHVFQTPRPPLVSKREKSLPITSQIPGAYSTPTLFEIPGSVGVVSERLLGAWAARHAGSMSEQDADFWEELYSNSDPYIKQMALCTQLFIGNDLDMTKLWAENGPPKRAVLKLEASGLIKVEALQNSLTFYETLAAPKIA